MSMFDDNEITISLEKLQGFLTNPEFLLYELGKEVERMANRELYFNPFKYPLSIPKQPPIQQKPFTQYRRPFPTSSGVRISRVTPNSVTVSMPREILEKVKRRLPEIEELFKSYLSTSARPTDIQVRLSSSQGPW